MKIKLIVISMITCILLIFSLVSCKNIVSTSTDSKSKVSEIVNSLKKDSSVKEYAISHNSKKIAVIKLIDNKYEAYITEVADNKQSIISDIKALSQLYTLSWSYNDKYIAIDDGTSDEFITYIINTSTLKEQLQIGDTGFVWANNKNSIAIEIVDDSVPQITPTELTGSSGVVTYDVDTNQKQVYLEPNPQNVYNVIKWDNTGLTVRINKLSK